MHLAYRTVLVLGACVLVTSAVAASTSPWVPATETAIGTQLAAMDAAVDPAGNAIAVWWTAERGIEAATRPVGAKSWRVEPVDQGPDRPEPLEPQVRVGVDANGNATVTWVEQYGDLSSFRVMAARRLAGGRYGAPQVVASGVDTYVGQTLLEVGAGGHAIVLWATRGRRDAVTFARVAIARPGGSFGDPQPIGSSLNFSNLADVAVDKQGRMLVVWRDLYERINASSATAGGLFGPGRVISGPEGYKSSPQVALGIGGAAIAVWSRWWPPSEINVIESTMRAIGGTWRAPEVVTTGPSSLGPCCPLLDADGTAHTLWIVPDRGGGGRRIATSVRPVGGSWQKPRTLVSSSTGSLQVLDLAANAAGEAIAVWRSEKGVASAYLRDGRWGSPVSPWPASPTAAVHGSAPSPAIDGAGNAFVVWSSCCDPRDNVSMRAGGYDAAGPQLRMLRIPATGHVGKPLRFSVSPLDVWSGRTVARWRFGDNRKATGISVAHTYRRPGTYTVTVASSDSRGHTTTATRRIRIR